MALIRTRRVCIVFLLFLALPVWTASGQEITLNVWINLWKDLQPIMEEAVAAYEAAHPGIKIDLQFERLSQGNEGYDKFIIATAAGVGPDLVMFSQWTELAERGLLEPLDAFLEHSELREKFHPAVWMEKSLDGLIYSVPAVEGGPNMGLLFNRDLFIESGLPDFHPDEVLTWTEFGDQVRRLARYDEEGRLVRLGFYPPEAGAHGLVKTASMWDVDWYDWETGRAVLDRPELVEAMETLRKFFYEPWGFEAVESAIEGHGLWTNQANGAFVNGVTGTIITGYWSPGELAITMPHGNIGVSWVPHNDRVRMQRLASWGFSIPAAGNHKEHVWKLLEYLVSAEVAASIYRNLGWLGGLHRDLPLHIDVTENPILLWYIESLDKADRIYGVKANPYLRTASSLWSEVYDKVMRGEGLARPLLEDANRTLNALIAEGQASL